LPFVLDLSVESSSSSAASAIGGIGTARVTARAGPGRRVSVALEPGIKEVAKGGESTPLAKTSIASGTGRAKK